MQAIQAPIKPGQSGPEVVNLQDALFALLQLDVIRPHDLLDRPSPEALVKLTEGLMQERVESLFGAATGQFVMDFQIQQGLGDHLRDVGVDDKTADKLNELLKKLRLFDIPEPDAFIVRGTVLSAEGQPIPGALVRAFDRDMRKDQPVGDAWPGSRGQYVIRFSSSQFAAADVPSAKAPYLIVRAFAGEQQIGKDVTRSPPEREEVIHFLVSVPEVSEWEKLCAAIAPLLLGQGEGDQSLHPGEINDSDLDFITRETGLERERVRLWALAFAVGKAAPLDPLPSAGTRAAFPLIVPAVAGGLSTFAIFYGWFRQGLPSELVALWATPTDVLISTLQTAIEQQVLPSISTAVLEGIKGRIDQIKLDRILAAPAAGGAASLGDLLATLPTPLNPDQQRVIAAAVSELRLDDPDLHNKIAAIPGFDGDRGGVARTLRLGALTGGHVPLAHALQRRPQFSDERTGTLLPLAALRPDEWLDLAYTHGTPNGLAMTPVAYAEALSARVERQHPTAALAAQTMAGRRLARQPVLTNVGTFLEKNKTFDIVSANFNVLADEADLGGIAEPEQLVEGLRALQRLNVLGASWDETATLLENDLYSPHQILAAGPGQLTAMLNGQLSSERTTALFQQAEELHNTTFAAITAALSPLSGPQILPGLFGAAAMGRAINPDDLGGGVTPTIPPQPLPDDDGTGNSLALKTLEEVLASRGGRFDQKKALTLREPPLKDLIRPGGPQLNLGGVIDRQPTLRALFGDQDACACGHCNSVLSPAAYFVDVLQFIKDARMLETLLKRRPDLEDIELSCNNTNTVVPAIDLALEALENAVAFELSVELTAGTNIATELIDGQPVGPAVKGALGKTVRNFAGEVRATRDTPEGNVWTVVDGRRRWKLTAQPEDALKSGRQPLVIVPTGPSLAAVIAALDRGKVASGAEAAFAGLFADGQKPPPDFTNYEVTITPLEPGKSWRVEYQVLAQVVTIVSGGNVVLQTPVGVVLWDQPYNQATIAAVRDDLSSSTVPALVQGLLASQFSKATAFTATPTGMLASAKRSLTLSFTPAQINITSLAYQSGDPSADALAWPENHNPAAYAQLKLAKFPWSLPVDLPLEEVRLFLERARISRLRLIELMLPVDRQSQADAPVNTVPSAQSTREDTALVFSARNRNAITVDARIGDTLTTTVSVTKGSLTVNDYLHADIRHNSTNSVTIRGTAAAINGALDRMVFVPPADYHGAATMTIASIGDAGTSVTKLALKIAPVADIADDTADTEEDQVITIPVLANDSFENLGRSITAINGQAITASGTAVSVAHGTVKLDAANQLIFAPTKDFNGQALFTYTVTSGEVTETATVHVTVNSANASSFALEVLGLSVAEATLIGAQKTALEVYDYWGVSSNQKIIFDAASGGFFTGASPLVLLQSVSILLQQSRLGFEELQSVLSTKFVSGEIAPLRIEPPTTCKPSEMTLPGLTPEHLDRLHRFVRLWRRLGCTPRELDLAIEAFGGNLVPETLVSLARLQRLKQQLELPLDLLVGGLYRLETGPWIDHLAEGAPWRPSLYAAIFQREDARALRDVAAFALRGDPLDLNNTPISDHAGYVGACLGIKASVVKGWVSGTDGLGIPDKLTLANLSLLGAAAGLCRALGIDREKLTHHLQLYGASSSPFRPAISAHERAGAMLDFIERFQSVAKTGIEVETLRYLLQHHEAPGSDDALDEKQLKLLADAAREAVRSLPDATVKSPPLTPLDPLEAEKAALAIRVAREDAVIAALATGLGAVRDLVDDLLRTRLRQPSTAGTDAAAIAAFLAPSFVDDNASLSLVHHTLVRLHKALFICDALKLSTADLRLLRTAGSDKYGFTALNFNALPVALGATPAVFAGFEQLLALVQLRGLGAGNLLHQYAAIDFDAPAIASASTSAAQVLLATSLGLEVGAVGDAASQLHITGIDQYRDPIVLTRLIELLVALKELGATVLQVTGLTAPSPHDAAAIDARELLRSKHGESQWHELIKPIADKLRVRQRDALVDYLFARDQLPRDSDGPQRDPGPRLRDADDLYERYLIDVQTGSCLKTTRLLQATAAVQLFVQRLLLNLEVGLSLTDDKRKLWDWMRSYRVWEANRKVFLFPENWLLPELRDDKTPIFRQMESALTEQEPSPESTRAALLGYLEELADLAQISVIAMYEDVRKVDETLVDEKGTSNVVSKMERTLYVVGRTPNEPYRYFWRSCEEFGGERMSWSGWEALEMDNANDFIMPFVLEGDLHVAWPIFRKTIDEKKGNLLWEVQITWTRRTRQGWIKRKIGKGQINAVKRLENKDASKSFAFRLNKNGYPITVPGSKPLWREEMSIYCYAGDEATEAAIKASGFTPKVIDKNNIDVTTGATIDSASNVKIEIKGEAYFFSEVDGVKKYRAAEGMTIKVTWWFQTDVEGRKLHSKEVITNSKGEFDFKPRYFLSGQVDTRFDGLVANKSEISLTFQWLSGNRTFDKRFSQTLVRDQQGYSNWLWIIGQGKPNTAIAADFKEDRPVTYDKVCSFNIDSRKDLRFGLSLSDMPALDEMPGLSVDGNRFSVTDAAITSVAHVSLGGDGLWLHSRRLKLPLSVMRATQPPVLGSPLSPGRIWYLRENDESFFLQKQNGVWHVWPDGQPFASSYRTTGALSTTALFHPAVQSYLHYEPTANTFRRDAAYANYNWELFLHAPLAIADYLASQQRFEEARRWLHAVFDPTTEEKNKYGVPQFWRFLKFKNGVQPNSIAQMLTWLADPKTTDPKVPDFEKEFAFEIAAWTKNPFMPHVVARLRPSAYQWHTFFAYLDVLIGWGDQLFRRDTRETVNEATLLYVLAAKLLGTRPRVIPAPTPPPAQTYRSLPKDKNGDLDGFGNAWNLDLPGVRKLARHVANRVANGSTISVESAPPKLLTSLGALAFCIPQNEKVTEFYDRVENRLFNVRNCRNIEGVFRDLPLYEPPIDPLLLIRAKAAGLTIESALREQYAPLPNYRFSFTLQKALELCAELKALGGALLSALEKKDAEQLTLLRSSHEIAMLQLVSATRKQQIAEADANITALQQSEVTILERFGQYQKLLGKPSITKGEDGLPVVEQSSSLTVSTDPGGGVSGFGLIPAEVAQLNWMATANSFTQAANVVHVVAGVLSVIPNTWGGNALVTGSTFGGSNLGSAASAAAKAIEMGAVNANYFASQMGTFAGYERRQDEWVHQSKLALAEMKQIQKQILAAQIRKSIAEHELRNHDTQIENAKQVDEFMRGKFTNQQLYRWMSSQIAQVYFRTYQLALDQARRAERTFKHELSPDSKATPFVKAGQWDSLKRGLLAGEHLHHDLKRMESAYLERNTREFEITKHVSLAQLAPVALILLKQTGKCFVSIPEALFDLDYPGHYLRRLKSVGISIPCVAGPYASISCTLTLKRSTVRYQTNLKGGKYERAADDDDDLRFRKITVPTQSIVTSNAQNDSGLFEASLRDERYLPFEGAGAISEWELELAKDFPAFDFETISDVVLHIRYTARDASGTLKGEATKALKATLALVSGGKLPLVRVFSLRHEFPSEWQRLLNPPADATGDSTMTLQLTQNRFPYLFQASQLKFTNFELLVAVRPQSASTHTAKTIKLSLMAGTGASSPAPAALSLKPWSAAGGSLLIGTMKVVTGGPGPWTLIAWLEKDPPGAIEDVLLVCRYTCT